MTLALCVLLHVQMSTHGGARSYVCANMVEPVVNLKCRSLEIAFLGGQCFQHWDCAMCQHTWPFYMDSEAQSDSGPHACVVGALQNNLVDCIISRTVS